MLILQYIVERNHALCAKGGVSDPVFLKVKISKRRASPFTKQSGSEFFSLLLQHYNSSSSQNFAIYSNSFFSVSYQYEQWVNYKPSI